MTGPEADAEPRSLLHLSAEDITRCSPEATAEWLLQRNAQHRARLLSACRSLRAAAAEESAAYQRLAAAVVPRPTP